MPYHKQSAGRPMIHYLELLSGSNAPYFDFLQTAITGSGKCSQIVAIV